MVVSANLGFPRIGAFRELKKAQEAYWKGAISQTELLATAKDLRAQHWKLQQAAGIAHIPSNDFSFYDMTLDTTALLGAVPSRYNWKGGNVDIDTYFAMARGNQKNGQDVVAMEMTKWFDTNYHYIVPEFDADQTFALSSTKIFDEFSEAKALGITTRPVIIGPVTYLRLGKMRKEGASKLALLPKLLPVYAEVLKKLQALGAEWVQIDEPALVLDLSAEEKKAFQTAYAELSKASSLKILIATYFDGLRDNTDLALSLPVSALHVDLVRAPNQLGEILSKIPADKTLSVGVIDGRNIWRADLDKALEKVQTAISALGSDRIQVAPSCSLLHTPVNLENEKKLDAELKGWLAFAKQKLQEVKALSDAATGKKDQLFFKAAADAAEKRRTSPRIHNQEVKGRVKALSPDMLNRRSPFDARIEKQREALHLPLLPTTTIGSFPQTQDVRAERKKYKDGAITLEQYDAFLEKVTEETVRYQEEIGIDVLVHGEFERNDMVEYFGEQLQGFAFTDNGWVQSYGSRGVKPPVIFGDVSRPTPMTVRWSAYAQSLTDHVMKGMLTGPITILQWSFVRDDQSREITCKQIALAIRDEVRDLEKAGIRVIQIDEPAIREGLPLRNADKQAYLKWAVDSFRISASIVRDETQIHTHMCYSEFNDIIQNIADMDADVISIETSRSAMELLDAFVDFKYPNDIGPGVYDIHSPRIPAKQEMEKLLEKALKVLKPEQIWVNPDCGLKTRNWQEVKPALAEMVKAAEALRKELAENAKKKTA